MKKLWIVLALALLAAGGPGAGGEATSVPSSASAAFDWTDPARGYHQFVATLAGAAFEGRGPQTAGLDKARDLLVEQFRQADLAPAFGASYLQPFTIAAGVRVESQSLSAVREGVERPEELAAEKDFAATGLSGDGRFGAAAVFVGYGLVNKARTFDSYGDGDAVRGKVAVCLRYEPHDEKARSLWASGTEWSASAAILHKASEAARRGAVALLVVNPPAVTDAVPLSASRSQGGGGPRASIPVLQVSTPALRRLLGGEDPEAALAALVERANQGEKPLPLEGLTFRGQAKLVSVPRQVHNVAGVVAGAGALAGQVVVVGAHYDHVGMTPTAGGQAVCGGADDNASGTAGMVLLARRMAARAAATGQQGLPAAPANRRTLLFVGFSAEELGLLGSRHLVTHAGDLGRGEAPVVAMLNFDMIGRLAGQRVSVWGGDTAKVWRAWLEDAAAGTDLKLLVSGSGLGPSDQASFCRAKIPVLCFHSGGHRDIHSPRDTADKINAEGAVAVVGLAERLLVRLWTEPEAPAYVAVPAGPEGPVARARLGVVPAVGAAAGEGVTVVQVAPEGAAEKAGIADGDVLVAWGETPLGSVEALLERLAAAKPGQSVTLTLRRAGAEKVVTVVLDAP